MSYITTSWTTATSEAMTRRSAIDRILREGFGEYGTVTSGTTSTIVDTTELQSSIYPTDFYKGQWARISRDAAGAAAAPEGEIRVVTASAPSTGTLTVNPVFSAEPAAGDFYQLFRYVRPKEVLDLLDQIMKEDAWLPCWTILTEVPDGDMEQNNTTDWTANNATVTKISTEPAMWGKRWLSVVTTSAGGYAQSNTLNVIPGETYHCSALVNVSAADTTAQMTIYDVTNSAILDRVESTYLSTVRIWTELTIPDTCHQIAIRLGNSENTVTSRWDEVCFMGLDQRDLPLPWWVKNQDQVKGVMQPIFERVGDNTWLSLPKFLHDPNRWDFRDDAFGRGQLRVMSKYGKPEYPVYVFGTRNEEAWANENTEKKNVSQNWLIARVLYLLFRKMNQPMRAGNLNMDWVKEQVTYWEKEWNRERRKQEERLSKSLQAEAASVTVYNGNHYAGASWEERSMVS